MHLWLFPSLNPAMFRHPQLKRSGSLSLLSIFHLGRFWYFNYNFGYLTYYTWTLFSEINHTFKFLTLSTSKIKGFSTQFPSGILNFWITVYRVKKLVKNLKPWHKKTLWCFQLLPLVPWVDFICFSRFSTRSTLICCCLDTFLFWEFLPYRTWPDPGWAEKSLLYLFH